jgi:lysylphosphatidylglycerol synthetase-like protein (DUF2156 family)
MYYLLFITAIFAYIVASLALHVYGIVLSFRKAWYIGLISILVPFFALIVGAAKLFFRTDILEIGSKPKTKGKKKGSK